MVEKAIREDPVTKKAKVFFYVSESELQRLVSEQIKKEHGTEINPEFIALGHSYGPRYFAETWVLEGNDGSST